MHRADSSAQPMQRDLLTCSSHHMLEAEVCTPYTGAPVFYFQNNFAVLKPNDRKTFKKGSFFFFVCYFGKRGTGHRILPGPNGAMSTSVAGPFLQQMFNLLH